MYYVHLHHKALGIWIYAYMQFLHKMMHWFLSRKYFRDKVSLSLKPTTLNFKSSCNSKMLLRVTENWELNLINLLQSLQESWWRLRTNALQ